ncbi:UDP-N-acetylglucosamine--dolichyl-phosphate [Sarracenia purpurea var. burkii]
MGARKRAATEVTTTAKPPATETQSKSQGRTTASASSTADPPVAPSKAGQILTVSLIFFVPYLYLIFSHYKIDSDIKRSIVINAVLSSAGFSVTLTMIPVASRYVLRRNLFGYDINKKGTPQGSVKVPESLGIAVGIVFLVLAILFQYFNFTSDSNVSNKFELRSYNSLVTNENPICSQKGISESWLVEYNAALASICFMMLLGFVDDVLDVPWRV